MRDVIEEGYYEMSFTNRSVNQIFQLWDLVKIGSLLKRKIFLKSRSSNPTLNGNFFAN